MRRAARAKRPEWRALAPWRPGPGEWDAAAAQHLFRRAGFGARPEELERALVEGPEATLEGLLEERGTPALADAAGVLLAAQDVELLQAWWMARILEGGALRERMALLWHGHFATSIDKVGDVRLMHAQNELFRGLGLGDFRALVHAVARDPAMLVWLDGDSNRRGQPNENFARELMELFALGIGHYDEHDVREAARAFSGWGTRGRAFLERPEHHDPGEKTILGRTQRFDGGSALDWILAQPACARHVARVLLRAFVIPRPAEEEVEELAAVLVDADWDLARTLRCLLGSALFHAPRARRARIAAPVELVALTARLLEVPLAPREAARMASAQGQALFRPPSVKGWDGGRAWITSGTWIARHNAMVRLLARIDERREGPSLEETLGLEGAAARAERVVARLLPEGAPAHLAGALERAERAAADARQALRAQVALVLTSPEFQRF